MNMQNNNFTFYKGYEGEPEIMLSNGNYSLHIWEGYFSDIFNNVYDDRREWKGFSRDYHEMSGTFSEENSSFVLDDLDEYISDLKEYENVHFDYDETLDVYHAVMQFLIDAKHQHMNVTLTVK